MTGDDRKATLKKITRIAYNSEEWKRPTGEARDHEGDTYNTKFGFGHEDWLFRSEWAIGGWRYAFLQGVNKSNRKGRRSGQVLDIALYTIEPDSRRRLVAQLCDVEVLSVAQAEAALAKFKDIGWYDKMIAEIEAVGGDVSKLGAADWAPLILNIRFRVENVIPFPPETFVPATTPGLRRGRYQLAQLPNSDELWDPRSSTGSLGQTTFPDITPIARAPISAVQITPEHAKMQKILMEELRAQHPQAEIRREVGFVDVVLATPDELVFFEIKSDLEPRVVLRHAIGQLLEYAYYQKRERQPTKLVIVGRRALTTTDSAYLERLTGDFRIPLEYRIVNID